MDGKQLAIFGNTTGSGQIYVTDPSGGKLGILLSKPELGYIMDGAWSRDGKQFVMWSLDNVQRVYLLNLDGTGFSEQELDQQVFAVPQFTPDGKGIVFYGADETSTGLFQVALDGSQTKVISRLVEDGTGFGFSPDGSQLAYVESDRTRGEARLITEDLATREKVIFTPWTIPEGSGSSLPNVANLSWAPDGKSIVFDLGRSPSDRFVFVAYVETRSMVRVADSAYAPAISADGKCLAYISNNQVFALDLSGVSETSITATRLLVGNLPDGRAVADTRLDKLQWRP
jgi:WD40 repeat protein